MRIKSGSNARFGVQVPSAYVATRTDPGSAYRRAMTRDWWLQQAPRYECWISDNVLIELAAGSWPGKDEALRLVEPLPRLEIDAEVLVVAPRYIDERLVPAGLGGDAAHLAVACVYEMDFLLTWNIRHLANPNKRDHLTAINRRLGLLTPQIVSCTHRSAAAWKSWSKRFSDFSGNIPRRCISAGRAAPHASRDQHSVALPRGQLSCLLPSGQNLECT